MQGTSGPGKFSVMCYGIAQSSKSSMKLLGEVVRRFEMKCHQHEDNTKLCFLFTSEPVENVQVFNRCIEFLMCFDESKYTEM